MQDERTTGARPLRAVALVGGLVLMLGGCRSETGYIWLPVYSEHEEATGRVSARFSVTCPATIDENPLVLVDYVDTVENVRFDAELFAPVCAQYDSLDGLYGSYQGFYYPSDEWQGQGRVAPGTFDLAFVDAGEPGYSEEDYVCFTLNGGTFARYRLPARHDVDGDVSLDAGCTYIGGGRIQINLGATVRNPPAKAAGQAAAETGWECQFHGRRSARCRAG